jgi:RNA polymerase sigma factor (TIGR02999 family)
VNYVFNSTGLRAPLESVATMIETQPLGDEAPQPGALAAGIATGMAAGEWFAVLYHELRRMARGELFRHSAITLGPNTLVHEAWIKLAPSEANFTTPAALVSYVARVMRSIVIDHIRERSSLKRGGEFDFTQFDTLADLRAMGNAEVLSVNDELQQLAKIDPTLSELVELKFFVGLTFAEIGALRQVSERTVQRDWDKARMLLFSSLKG